MWNMLGDKCTADKTEVPSGYIFIPLYQAPQCLHNQFVMELKTSLSNYLFFLMVQFIWTLTCHWRPKILI